MGIKVTIVEPGGFATEWGGPSAKRARWIAAYEGARASLAHVRTASKPGDPAATGPVMLKLVDMEQPPLRIFFGDGGLPMIKRAYASRLSGWEAYTALSIEAQGNPLG